MGVFAEGFTGETYGFGNGFQGDAAVSHSAAMLSQAIPLGGLNTKEPQCIILP